jgi:2-iminobutanoate/2-iminopropanoate deaminase
MMDKQVVHTDQAPKALGPYSQAIRAGMFIFCAGQTPIDPATGNLVEGGIEAQTRRVLQNLGAVVQAAGTSMDRVVKTTVFLLDMNDFQKMNAVYAEFFPTHPPARSTVQVARLPKDARVEIELVALA